MVKYHFILFITSVKENNRSEILIKTIESPVRPFKGDIVDDPGFLPAFHNGYEVVKVTLNYELEEGWVSLSPLDPEKQEIELDTYVERLKANGWRVVSKEEIRKMH